MVLSLAVSSMLSWVHHVLGKSYSPKLEIKVQHKLITKGPYRFIRHPMYAAIFFWTLGLTLIIANWTTAFLPFAFGLFIILRIPKEEEMMIDNLVKNINTILGKPAE